MLKRLNLGTKIRTLLYEAQSLLFWPNWAPSPMFWIIRSVVFYFIWQWHISIFRSCVVLGRKPQVALPEQQFRDYDQLYTLGSSGGNGA